MELNELPELEARWVYENGEVRKDWEAFPHPEARRHAFIDFKHDKPRDVFREVRVKPQALTDTVPREFNRCVNGQTRDMCTENALCNQCWKDWIS